MIQEIVILKFKNELVKGIRSVTDNIKIVYLGYVTTPQHHFFSQV